MTKFSLRVFVFFCAIFVTVNGRLPSTIPVCSRNHPNLSECFSNAIKTLQPRIATGDLGPGYKVAPLEPLYIPQITYGEDQGLKVHLSNVQIKGASRFKIEKLRVNYQDLKIDVLLTVPKLNIFAKYKLSFNFLNEIVKSDGEYLSEFENSKIRVTLKGQKYFNNGQEFARLDPLEVKFQRGKVIYVRLTNLFGGRSPAISDVVHSILNNNPDFALNQIYPQVNGYLSKFATEMAEKIFNGTPLDELFPN
ncbi:hypothetical protein PVAND_014693 [Polypedilum vanderplanki]|uniref:Hemolymph juvenile hormone binding protein n=1 Tax=Polypedilum vanderplanki TaxID=319348 RepID=A0A9J6BAQ2_POLVA|nr:hypothetical protein PVAND_014693 [Polypedilum vanderplanki]